MMIVIAMRHPRLRAVTDGVTQHGSQALSFMTFACHFAAGGKKNGCCMTKILVGCFLAFRLDVW
jgi:hypothetical protein